MNTTIQQQNRAVKKLYSAIVRRQVPIGEVYSIVGLNLHPEEKQALNDAGSTLLAISLIIGDPVKFRKELRKAIVDGPGDSITDNVLVFLRSKGLPV